MSKVTHDLVVKTGTYVDKNGETKGRYKNIGFVMSHNDGGTSIKLECLPIGLPNWDGWVSVYKKDDPKQGATGGSPASQGQPPSPPMATNQYPENPETSISDDDIPF
ncbi:Helix-destabilizing protein [Gammaproteobacteria bacterium]